MVLRPLSNGGASGNEFSLPLRFATAEDKAPGVQLHPVVPEDDRGGLLVTIQPPKEPATPDLRHVPCDLVLSIDVSGSMHSEAPAPSMPGEEGQEGEREEFGLSVLDLVKHAARTIIETLDANDRLGIVTFSSRTKVVKPLTPMTPTEKAETIRAIEGMTPYGSTNLWHGIRDALKLFKKGQAGEPGSTGRVPALLVLTDGEPNYMCPQQGYVRKLRTMQPLPAAIHTFGFGYSLKSGLLKSIAEVGGGNYSFIPDAGMIGTVFVHAVANLQSTFANDAKLRLTYPSYLKLEETTGEAVDKLEPVEVLGDTPEPLTSLTILLGNLQYGQSRNIYLAFAEPLDAVRAQAGSYGPLPTVTAVLEYQHYTVPTVCQVKATIPDALDFSSPSAPPLDPAEVAYHVSRAKLIAFLSTFYPLNAQLEHKPLADLPPDMPAVLEALARSLPASSPDYATSHPGCRALLTDLCGEAVAAAAAADAAVNNGTGTSTTYPPSRWTGQIALALLRADYYRRWGAHYLPSLAGAHARQACNSFKDAGPLRYGADSPLFAACRDRLDAAFDALPPPTPTRAQNAWAAAAAAAAGGGGAGSHGGGGGGGGGYGPGGRGKAPRGPLPSMKRFNNAGSGCFAGCVRVLLACRGKNGSGSGSGSGAGMATVRVGRLRKGMEVITPKGPRKVAAVLRMPVRRAQMCLVGSRLLVTPWHPVSLPREGAGAPWQFPKDVAAARSVRYTGSVYSVMLERDDDADAHAILVGGVWGVTMGHGLTDADERSDVRAHRFYGDYDKVAAALAGLPGTAGGVVLGGGLTRDPATGLVIGFSRAAAQPLQHVPALKGMKSA